MKAEVYIISGFLGAGKTTLIQKLLREYFPGSKTALIENDFGEVSVDASLFRSGGFEVKEINSGCICCSLAGDFITAMEEILRKIAPEKIIIEPSGVGKLSDVISACSDGRLSSFIELRSKITVIDSLRFYKYLDNFGEFFEDQIRQADKLVLSRSETSAQLEQIKEELARLNPKAEIFDGPFAELDSGELMIAGPSLSGLLSLISSAKEEHHRHTAEDTFDTLTLRPLIAYDPADLRRRMERLGEGDFGQVLRCKGVLKTKEGVILVQFLPESIDIRFIDHEEEPILCIIGHQLQRERITTLFQEAR
ncbi:MAG: GTP-binding protein [Peptostreptococcaceae bacterium]|nr:GTP-binding protein [Peptostreptococcaceae bacterium]